MIEKDTLIDNAYNSLLDLVKEGNIHAVKFTLENLDEKFSIQYKELLTSLFKKIVDRIEQFNGLDNTDKINVISIIKILFAEYL